MIKIVCAVNMLVVVSSFIHKVSGDSEEIFPLDDKSRGFGKQFDWLSLNDGLQMAKRDNKPLMLIIQKSWCTACKALKPKFATSKSVEKLSKHFVMVSVVDDEEPQEKIYFPDGGYIPRILFLDPAGRVMENIYNEDGNPSYKYFYSDTNTIAASMKRVLAMISNKDQLLDEL